MRVGTRGQRFQRGDIHASTRARVPSIDQWKTAVPVTSATVDAETHFQ